MNEQDRQRITILISEVARGSIFALEDLSRLVSGRMLAVALTVLADRTLAEDAVQDSFVKIVKKAHTFNPDTNGYGWICKIVHNTALNVLRHEKRFKAENTDNCFNLSDGTDVAENASDVVAVKQALSVLDRTEKTAIYQKYFMDFSLRDIARNIKKSKSATQRLIKLAEEKIREVLLDKESNLQGKKK